MNRWPLSIGCLVTLTAGLLIARPAQGEDWPTWRHDANRSAATGQALAAKLNAQWVRHEPAPAPAWPEDARLLFDESYEPVVVGKTMFVVSSANDTVRAIDTTNGAEKWRYYAEGPVRMAPVAAAGRLYFGCDDGLLYCLNAADGALLWKLGDRPDRRVLGNGRLISVWPVRGAPVLADGNLHFTTGVWPFEGAFLYTVDLKIEGELRYDVTTLRDVSPQGFLAAAGGKVFVPGGRGPLMCFDAVTKQSEPLKYNANGFTDFHTVSVGDWVFHGGAVYSRSRMLMASTKAPRPVVAGDAVYCGDRDVVRALDLAHPTIKTALDRRGKQVKSLTVPELWRVRINPPETAPTVDPNEKDPVKLKAAKQRWERWLAANPVRIDLVADGVLYGHRATTVFAMRRPKGKQSATITWDTQVDATVTSMLAADDKLFVVTRQGTIYCFGQDQKAATQHQVTIQPLKSGDDAWAKLAAEVLKAGGTAEGYAMVLGIGTGRLVEELVAQSKLNVIAIDPDAKKVAALRRRLDAAGVYGRRASVITGEPVDMALPPYLANVITSEDLAAAGIDRGDAFVQQVFRCLRPYGGTACLALTPEQANAMKQRAAKDDLPKAQVRQAGALTLLTRPGALPGSADWTHEYGDAGNTLMSPEQNVKAPLGLLWYGGPASSPDLFYDRHEWPPSMAVIDGRIFMQGPGVLSAVDVYTGRLLWKKQIPRGKSPGRRGNFTNTGYHSVATHDSLYLAYPKVCLRLDPVTGKELGKFTLPDQGAEWGRIRAYKDALIVPVFRAAKSATQSATKRAAQNTEMLPAELLAMDRHSGMVLWTAKAKQSFPLVAIGGDRIFCYDGYLEKFYVDGSRKGGVPVAKGEKANVALDAATGKEIWRRPVDMVTSWLSYSNEHDVLTASNAMGMTAYHGADGYKLWEHSSKGVGFKGHPEAVVDKVILWHNQVIDQRGPGLAYDLLTGAPKMAVHPLTQQPVQWEFTKVGHHCNYAIASEHLITFRAASAGFTDLDTGGSSALEGFRSGCRNSLIPADGVLNAPNYANGCICSYSIFTSLALVNEPSIEQWTYSAYKPPTGRVEKVGVNLGAPGDRKASDGTLWLNYPSSSGGPSPNVPVKITGKGYKYFSMHASKIQDETLPWVSASGLSGAATVSITLDKDANAAPKAYTVRLVFSEPEIAEAGQRVFDVSVQGKKVLSNFDVIAEAGATRRTVVKSFDNVRIGAALDITLTAHKGEPLLCGVEVVAVK